MAIAKRDFAKVLSGLLTVQSIDEQQSVIKILSLFNRLVVIVILDLIGALFQVGNRPLVPVNKPPQQSRPLRVFNRSAVDCMVIIILLNIRAILKDLVK